MAGLLRIARAMVGTGLTFAVGVGVVGSVVGLVVVLAGQGSWHDLYATLARLSVAAFVLGIAFSGILALSARGRRLAELSGRRFAALGAGAGLLYFLFIATNAIGRWSLADAIGNLVILTVVGAGAATGIFLLARPGRSRVGAVADAALLGAGGMPGGNTAACPHRTPVEVA
jgi:hypothetical protein